jgi:PPOX class probable F420-dependent enzyme
VTLDEVMEMAAREQYLAVVATLRADSTIQSSLVNAGALDHPISGEPVLAFVTYGAAKLRNLRVRPQLAVTFRSAWAWAAIEGNAELVGPDDPHPEVDAERLRVMLRDIFTAAGGTHDDWDAYDRTMLEQHRTAVS